MTTIYAGFTSNANNANLDTLAGSATAAFDAANNAQSTANNAETEMGLLVDILTPATGGGEGGKNVTVAGTPEPLAATTACRSVTITARDGNTGRIAWGFSNAVRATDGSEIGATLGAGESATIAVADVADVWIDASVSSEGVSYTYAT